MKRTLLSIMIMISLELSGFSTLNYAQANEGGESGIHLSKKLRRILSAEMNAVQNGITNLAIAVPAGKWNEIAETAKQMSMTYIMKKKLAKKQLDEFYNSVPEGYKAIDSDFYKSTKMLSTAALERDLEQVNLLFYKLNESCVKCHSKYASHRFPGFKREND